MKTKKELEKTEQAKKEFEKLPQEKKEIAQIASDLEHSIGKEKIGHQKKLEQKAHN